MYRVKQTIFCLVHGLNKSVDVLLAVTQRTTLNEVLELSWDTPATSGVGEVERPEEVVGLLEVGANSVDFVEKVLNGDDAVLAESGLNDSVVQLDALVVELAVTTLVDELSDSRKTGVTVSNVGLNETEELLSGLGDTDKGTVVDLEKSQKLENLAGLRSDLVDTLDSDNKDKLWLSRDIEGTVSSGSTLLLDKLTLGLLVLLLVSGSTLVDDLVLGLKRLINQLVKFSS